MNLMHTTSNRTSYDQCKMGLTLRQRQRLRFPDTELGQLQKELNKMEIALHKQPGLVHAPFMKRYNETKLKLEQCKKDIQKSRT